MSDYPFFFTWTAQNAAKPLELTGGEGAWFTTADGARWLDLGALELPGQRGPRPASGSSRRSSARPTSCACRRRTRCSRRRSSSPKRLLAMAGPGFSKVFFTLGGAEANENAIKIARLVTGRLKNIARYRSYHGASMGALSLTGDWRRPPLEPRIPGVVHVQDCYCDRCPFGQRVETCKRECATNIGDVDAARGPGSSPRCSSSRCRARTACSCRRRSTGRSCARRATREGALLVADEVLTGFGRTGKPFGFQHWDVVPDMITVAKGLASGYATIGAVIVHERDREALRRPRARVRPDVLRAPDGVRRGGRDAEASTRTSSCTTTPRGSAPCCGASSTRSRRGSRAKTFVRALGLLARARGRGAARPRGRRSARSSRRASCRCTSTASAARRSSRRRCASPRTSW